ncbi:MAG: YihA family ribosome biogenesis GTP-binding protein [Ruminococcaceae bacterium]|nr:YihA family ribosome biogenesis GTP-binding protein [Oscillospiraceae bacterium]
MNVHSAAFEMAAGTSSQLPVSGLPEVAFSGRSNVGKSSLINRLVNRKALARTSATPGKTATINFYRLDTMRMVDLPGYGYAKVSDSERRRWSELIEGYFDDDRDLRLVLQLWDMRHDPSKDDQQMLEYMVERGIPFIIVLTKSDKLNKTERAKRLAAFDAILADLEGITVIPFSAVNGEGADQIREILDQVTADDE